MEKKATVRGRLCRKAVSLSLTAALAATAFSGLGMVAFAQDDTAQNDYGLVDNIQDGTILHCFDWKYKDIKAELENIAKAGFTSIQTSPAQASEGVGGWYWLYQPIDFKAGTNELGTPEELADLCQEADKYGIKVVVDVVANHLAGNHDNIPEALRPDQYWHNEGKITSYSNRHQVTHGDLGMADINSEDSFVQQSVAAYIDELKGMGVDGIRWDAAKHIGLPSEDCGFWPAVTQAGLYNYGEILTSPVDGGGDDLMKEYTDYMSVTDSSYATSMVSAFNSGKAPAKDGNWTGKGIDASKLVYWGESHDTYSNAEGKETNAVSQNVIDRAYAVGAARNGATALYLSRPYAKARDSIRIGVKGSTHFTSPEIAAVNHFHNAMVGKKDAYAVSNNCSVVTRENGGAVIVCGSGSGDVSVENVNGYVAPGTYKDEVTGNTFTVTEATISGKVGESGIAVVYDSAFVSKVYAEPDSDTSFKNTMKVTLHAVEVEEANYEFTDGSSNKTGSFKDGDVIEVGANTAEGSALTLTLTGKGTNGKALSAVYTYNKKVNKIYPELSKGGVVLDNTGTAWKTVNVYVYDESGATTITNASWPGEKMEDCGNNLFKYELPDQFASCSHIMVIFNNGAGDQIPGMMQDGLTMAYTDKKMYEGTTWIDLPENDKTDDGKTDDGKTDDGKTDDGKTYGKTDDGKTDGKTDAKQSAKDKVKEQINQELTKGLGKLLGGGGKKK